MKQRNDQPVWVWILIAAMGIVALTALTGLVRADTKVEVFGGHWGHHWSSPDITNEKHALVCLRVEWAIGCSFRNSYRQPGFSGESYAVGLIDEIALDRDVGPWHGQVELMGSIGMTYGYTAFMGHVPGGKKKWYPYIAPGLFYAQPEDGWEWKAGAIQFGDDTIPALGVGARF